MGQGRGRNKGGGEWGFLNQSTVKDEPHSANCFSVLGSCTVGSTKDMLDSNVPPMTEEAVSKPSTPEPADPPYVLLCSTTFQRSTYIPLHIHTVNSNLPMAMNVLIDTGAEGGVRGAGKWFVCSQLNVR